MLCILGTTSKTRFCILIDFISPSSGSLLATDRSKAVILVITFLFEISV